MYELDFYNKVGKINGWDFSHLQVSTEGVKWNFYEEVKKRSLQSDVLLDLGTGGGENLLRLAPAFLFLVGIDFSSGMIEKANKNLGESDHLNIRFSQMNNDDLQFPHQFFDRISSCHAPFHSMEVAKVLRDGGTFMTQQVSEADKLNIKLAFGRGQAYEEKDGSLKERYVKELEEAGFSSVQSYEYDSIEYYKRPEDLLFLLKHTPIIPEFAEDDSDIDIFNQFIKENMTEKGIRTNSKRFLLVANK
ncbi:class I SAM-dependent methyltransferase [Alkalicoccobacillus murimartini]|uniref:SAM-dependent methyltransferase n=1 Tax=Alkalicoccobacillus murimartini TaxID=171685 RepID=A0ABT9YI45_9BACI|nr:class I SAM-dependent methyltransferase [Alkalicoccobacillus murimartini]MDQ0207529.1 SAM-dependent methyltransferase [Alkalicoccobacillus murimartini]